MRKLIVLCFILGMQVGAAEAQGQARTDEPQSAPVLEGQDVAPPAHPPGEAPADLAPTLTSVEFQLGIAVLVFGFTLILLEFLHFQRLREPAAVQDVLLMYGITLIIIGALFLIVIGLSSTQVAPAFGLFGTIVGYLLGKRTSSATP